MQAIDVSQLTIEHMAAGSPGNLMTYHTDGEHVPPKHLREIDRWFLELIYGDIDLLIVLVPPGCAKSTYSSHYAAAWHRGTFPDGNVMVVSYGTDFAASWGGKARDVLRDVGKKVFGVSIDPNRKSEQEWALRGRRGRMYCEGLDGQVTGKRLNLLIADDMYKTPADATSESYRNTLIDFMQDVAFGRRLPNGKMLVINYRWNLRDIQAWLVERCEAAGMKVKILTQPAIAGENDELGREPGEALWPEMYDLDYLRQQEILVGPRTWAAQYQQSPAPAEGTLFLPQWWQYWGPERPTFDEKWMAVDCALKDLQSSDFVVVGCWGRKGDRYYRLTQDRRRMDYPGTKAAIRAMHAAEQPRYVHIEDTANGPAVIQALRKEISGIIPFSPRKHGSKEDRAQAVSDLAKQGRVFLPRPIDQPWVEGYIAELAAFPNGAYDDQVDETSIALARFAGSHLKKIEAAKDDELHPRRRMAWFAQLREKQKKQQRAPHFGPGFDDVRAMGG